MLRQTTTWKERERFQDRNAQLSKRCLRTEDPWHGERTRDQKIAFQVLVLKLPLAAVATAHDLSIERLRQVVRAFVDQNFEEIAPSSSNAATWIRSR